MVVRRSRFLGIRRMNGRGNLWAGGYEVREKLQAPSVQTPENIQEQTVDRRDNFNAKTRRKRESKGMIIQEQFGLCAYL